MLAWLAPLLVFGLVVLVHEAGHFIAAKLMGVYAPRFSIGFGRPLWRRRRGETEYVLSALPLGGYVRMASREDEATAFLEGGSEMSALKVVGANDSPALTQEGEQLRPRPADWDPNAMIPFGPKPVPEHRWFESKSLLARVFILSAGVLMNVILALVVSTGLFATYGISYRSTKVDSIVAGRPAAAAGLQAGDSIVAVDGTPVTRWDEVVDRVMVSAGRPLSFGVLRDGRSLTLQITPELSEETDSLSRQQQRVGRIGAAAGRQLQKADVPFTRAVARGWDATWAMAGAVLGVLGGLFSGSVSLNQLGGPIEIARSSVQAAKSGIETLWSLIAFLSINVAVLNLLPIPILDGGQILMNVIESAKGSAFSSRTKEYIMRAGLLAIALLFALVMFNDLKRVIVDRWFS
jgi:regulator of sigma E protease